MMRLATDMNASSSASYSSLYSHPTNAPGKASEGCPGRWGPDTQVGDLNEALGSWLWPDPPQVIATIFRGNQ